MRYYDDKRECCFAVLLVEGALFDCKGWWEV